MLRRWGVVVLAVSLLATRAAVADDMAIATSEAQPVTVSGTVELQQLGLRVRLPRGDDTWQLETKHREGGLETERLTRTHPAPHISFEFFRAALGAPGCGAGALRGYAQKSRMVPRGGLEALAPGWWREAAEAAPVHGAHVLLFCIDTLNGPILAAVSMRGALSHPDARLIPAVLRAVRDALIEAEDRQGLKILRFDFALQSIKPDAYGGSLTIDTLAVGFTSRDQLIGGAVGLTMGLGYFGSKRVLYDFRFGLGPALNMGFLTFASVFGVGSNGISGPGGESFEMKPALYWSFEGLLRATASPTVHLDLTGARLWRGDIGGDAAIGSPTETRVGLRAVHHWHRTPGVGFQGMSFGFRYTDYVTARGVALVLGVEL